jgi:hypothetical protein
MSHVIRIDMIYFYVDIGYHINPIDYTMFLVPKINYVIS